MDLTVKVKAGQTKQAKIGGTQGRPLKLDIKGDGKVDKALLDGFESAPKNELFNDIRDLSDFHKSNGASGLPEEWGQAADTEGSEQLTGHKNRWNINMKTTADGFVAQTVGIHGDEVSLGTTFLSVDQDEKGSKVWHKIEAKLDANREIIADTVEEKLEWLAVDYSQ